MNVLLLGSGGREHALAWKLRQSPQVEALVALPGNDGMADLARCVPGDPCRVEQVEAAAAAHDVNLTVIGPEAPLAAGVADALRGRGRAVFGPSRAAAQLESSKIFAKEFMRRNNIPTAEFAMAATPEEARRALARFSLPVVIKADGLAAGKGVVVAATAAEAEAAAEAMLTGELAGAAGRHLLVEECLMGPEVSLLAICDGERWLTLPPARDHKRLGDGDRGPNTGGMGAYSVDGLLPPALRERIERGVIQPVLFGMAAAGTPFQGVLYCGLMLTPSGPRVLEFNVRFGDPETQAILLRVPGDLAALLAGAAAGRLPERLASPAPGAAACVVAAAAGYPGTPGPSVPITGLEPAAGAEVAGTIVFHAGTRRRESGWETAGGRVLGVAAAATTAAAAAELCYRRLAGIHFAGMQARTDIGAVAPELAPGRAR